MNQVAPRNPPFRSRSLLDLAHRVHDCQIKIPEVCTGWTPEGCEPVHPNWSSWTEKGMGQKASDLCAAGCHACGMAIDQGKDFSHDERELYWHRGFWRTQRLYWAMGWVRLA